MNAIQIICLIFIMIICYFLGWKSRIPRIPIVGAIDLDAPRIEFYVNNISDLKKYKKDYKYVAIILNSRQNQQP